MNNNDIKISHLDQQYDVRNEFFEKPILKQLFFELTLNCNEHCWHCGSRCGDVRATEMAPQEWKDILDQIKEDFNGSLPQINVTGGEPLLYPGFEEVMSYAHSLGFKWGMTSNAILITPEIARMLQRCGMNTISVSIDGLPETHDRISGLQGGYKRAMKGIQNLIDLKCFGSIMVTTVVNHETVRELDSLYEVMCDVDIDSWRIMGIEPIGRALDHPELLLTDDDHRYIMDFISSKRANNDPVTYGCCHYLGLDYEKEVRDWYFFCMAGVTVASITVTGDVYGCLDIDRTQPGVIQGNIHDRRFSDIWKNEFKAFRRDRAEDNEKCANCKSRKYCMGGAFHTWDLVNKTQRLCLIDALDREKHEQ
ncbi:radical SAM additional 4Fe4S-binding SPASM domain-containing protein [Butyrivibrio sp. INlla18]|uniref:radical SAM/SPASM domain-containing protein n=1 Tax=Butyrivibrio sp. INlla18 TaxID=1520806 RepID=UPI000887D80E|nr:radical SAM protein [Butyrivibrio sp. INlla18]SDA62425.1 radical SAM additional 4Fe4S-binding SPASM domain-containing protein [Butyrivibrio sp. INlla18]